MNRMNIDDIFPPDLTPEEEAVASQSRRHGHPDDRTRLSHWFPLIRDVGLPVPRTEIVIASDEEIDAIWSLFDGDDTQAAAFETLCGRIRSAAAVIGTPCFLRTDFTSAKHSWKDTCYLANVDGLGGHVSRLAEESAMADVMGLPFDVWAVRELLPTAPLFTAFWGQMPITREFRFFVKDGTIVHHQPYWPPDSIADHQPSRRDWQRALAVGSAFEGGDYVRLASLAEAAGRACGGYWSVDMLLTTDRGWVITDMAEGEKSFMWGPPL